MRPHSRPWAWASLLEPRGRPTVSAVCSRQGRDSALRPTVYVLIDGEAATVECKVICLRLCQGRKVKNRRKKQLLREEQLERDGPGAEMDEEVPDARRGNTTETIDVRTLLIRHSTISFSYLSLVVKLMGISGRRRSRRKRRMQQSHYFCFCSI